MGGGKVGGRWGEGVAGGKLWLTLGHIQQCCL